jgi:membrane protein implicated in regulation of membrane protease activity
MAYLIVGAWFLVAIIALVIELETAELVSVWFVVGAFVSMIVSACIPTNYAAQICTFAIVSVIALLILRPILSKKFNLRKTQVDNINTMEGYEGFAETDMNQDGGKVNVNGTSWQAVSDKEIEKGMKIVVVRENNITLVVREEGNE